MVKEINRDSKIYIAGHTGMVGSAITRVLTDKGFKNLIYATSRELDLTDQGAVTAFFREHHPDYVILAAARVGGIQANLSNPAVFLYDNLAIQNNVVHQSYLHGVKKLVFLGSSCIYPRECAQPMKEEYLLSGKLEPTNEGYALAKISGLKMCSYYYKQYGFRSISLMPCNLYGPNDSFDLQHSHVLSAMVRRFVDARDAKVDSVTLWGTGIARREFMHVNDCARAIFYLMEHYDSEDFINIGWGVDLTIRELAETIRTMTGYTGNVQWDNSKPDGMLRKCMDVSRMHETGFTPIIALQQGIQEMIGIYEQLKETNSL
jgi:GDP-L-fucose synthase